MQECWKNKNGLFQYGNSPLFHPILFHFVPWHFGQGGRVSELSSNLITSPHFTHLYKPLPGFSPVEYIIEKIKRLITSYFNCLSLLQTKTVLKHYLECFFVGPTLIVSVTVVPGLFTASLFGTNCPVPASRTLVDVLLMIKKFKFNHMYGKP